MALIVRNKFSNESLNGKWANYGDGEFLIAENGTSAYNKILQDKIDAESARLGKNKKIAEEKKIMMGIDVVIDTTLRDWKNLSIINDDGQEEDYPYSKENAIDLLRSNMEIMDWILEYSRNKENYMLEASDEDVKKSSASSNGKKKTKS